MRLHVIHSIAGAPDVWLLLPCANQGSPHGCEGALRVGFNWADVPESAAARRRGSVYVQVEPSKGSCCSHLLLTQPKQPGRAAAAPQRAAQDATLASGLERRLDAVAGVTGACGDRSTVIQR
jgi:hypothetical protein